MNEPRPYASSGLTALLVPTRRVLVCADLCVWP